MACPNVAYGWLLACDSSGYHTSPATSVLILPCFRMSRVVNVASYKFAPLADLPEKQAQLLALTQAHALKGTILLAPEGINLFLAGAAANVQSVLDAIQAMPEIGTLEVKHSYSDDVPFGKMRVRIKREIIRMDHPAIRPVSGRAPAVDPSTLARWLDQGHDDQGRPVVMLDTRNAFEVDAGTFEGAIDWRIGKFTEFPQALKAHRQDLANKTVVSFCTGGIRCEKAALFMAEEGVENVFQLEGGILKYFETVGQKHYAGTCFVFDERETLDATLAPSAQSGTAAVPATNDSASPAP